MSLMFQIVLITYEFTFSPFSGNGILARSIVRSLLDLGCKVTVWCCQPHDSNSQSKNNHLDYPEISKEAMRRLFVIPLKLNEDNGWRKLDKESAWHSFSWENMDSEQKKALRNAVIESDVVCAIDWTGAKAFRSLGNLRKPLVYMNFRVYSSGVNCPELRSWFNKMENDALQDASCIIALSEDDRLSLQSISISANSLSGSEILLPPLRRDLEDSIALTKEELYVHMPEAIIPSLRKHQRFICCVVRLSPEKQVLRFVRFIEQVAEVLKDLNIIPLLAGAVADVTYASQVKDELKKVAPQALILEGFLSPTELAALFSECILNFHPCAYDAYGMTIIEAAACGVPSVVSSRDIGAVALLQESCFQIDFTCNIENEISMECCQRIVDLICDSEKLHILSVSARKKAHAWNDIAYGKRLLQIISDVVDKFNCD
jgi:glycosyltransferase involved in cell wall biosynthesis